MMTEFVLGYFVLPSKRLSEYRQFFVAAAAAVSTV
jgi:hypothetical protein